MPYCPNCLEEYDDGMIGCVICGSELIDGAMPGEDNEDLGDMEPVFVGSLARALPIKSALEDEGLSVFLSGDDEVHLSSEVLAGPQTMVKVMVPTESAVEAARIVDKVAVLSEETHSAEEPANAGIFAAFDLSPVDDEPLEDDLSDDLEGEDETSDDEADLAEDPRPPAASGTEPQGAPKHDSFETPAPPPAKPARKSAPKVPAAKKTAGKPGKAQKKAAVKKPAEKKAKPAKKATPVKKAKPAKKAAVEKTPTGKKKSATKKKAATAGKKKPPAKTGSRMAKKK